VDKILSEDSDISHLEARAGTILSQYINWKPKKHRYSLYALYQAEKTTEHPKLRRCVRAALLGTNYSLNKPIMPKWSEVDDAVESLMDELEDRK
jgi:hypothetical protein